MTSRAVGAGAQQRWALAVTGFCALLNLYAPQAILPSLAQFFGAPPIAAGLTITATTLAVAVCAPFAGALADRVGRKRVIVAALVLLTVPTLLSGLSTSLVQLIVTRFAQGLFMPAAFAAALGYIGEECDPADLGRTMSLYIAANVSGGFAGRALGGVAATFGDWHDAFFLLAGLDLVGALLVWRLLPAERRRQAGGGARSVRALFAHLRDRLLLSAYAVGFSVLFGLVAVFTYVNFYLAAPPFGLSPAALGLVFCVYLVGIVVTPVAGRWIDRLGQKRTVMLAAGLSAAGCLLTLAPSLVGVIAGLALFCTGAFICQAAATSYVGLIAGANRSSAAGLYLTFYYMGGAFASLLAGLAWGWLGWPGCVGLGVSMQVVMVGLTARLWRR